jgi:hypothetical protein
MVKQISYMDYSHFYLSCIIFILFFLTSLVSLLFLGFFKELRKKTKMLVTSGVPCTSFFWSKQTIELVWFDKSNHTVTLITLSPRSLVVLSLLRPWSLTASPTCHDRF